MDPVKPDNEGELTSTMDNVISVSSKDEKSDTSSDATPTSSTDANIRPAASHIALDDPISSTSSDSLDQIKMKMDKGDGATVNVHRVSTDNEADLLDITNISNNERITEDVEDLVHDLESLLGESTDSFNVMSNSKFTKKDTSSRPGSGHSTNDSSPKENDVAVDNVLQELEELAGNVISDNASVSLEKDVKEMSVENTGSIESTSARTEVDSQETEPDLVETNLVADQICTIDNSLSTEAPAAGSSNCVTNSEVLIDKSTSETDGADDNNVDDSHNDSTQEEMTSSSEHVNQMETLCIQDQDISHSEPKDYIVDKAESSCTDISKEPSEDVQTKTDEVVTSSERDPKEKIATDCTEEKSDVTGSEEARSAIENDNVVYKEACNEKVTSEDSEETADQGDQVDGKESDEDKERPETSSEIKDESYEKSEVTVELITKECTPATEEDIVNTENETEETVSTENEEVVNIDSTKADKCESYESKKENEENESANEEIDSTNSTPITSKTPDKIVIESDMADETSTEQDLGNSEVQSEALQDKSDSVPTSDENHHETITTEIDQTTESSCQERSEIIPKHTEGSNEINDSDNCPENDISDLETINISVEDAKKEIENMEDDDVKDSQVKVEKLAADVDIIPASAECDTDDGHENINNKLLLEESTDSAPSTKFDDENVNLKLEPVTQICDTASDVAQVETESSNSNCFEKENLPIEKESSTECIINSHEEPEEASKIDELAETSQDSPTVSEDVVQNVVKEVVQEELEMDCSESIKQQEEHLPIVGACKEKEVKTVGAKQIENDISEQAEEKIDGQLDDKESFNKSEVVKTELTTEIMDSEGAMEKTDLISSLVNSEFGEHDGENAIESQQTVISNISCIEHLEKKLTNEKSSLSSQIIESANNDCVDESEPPTSSTNEIIIDEIMTTGVFEKTETVLKEEVITVENMKPDVLEKSVKVLKETNDETKGDLDLSEQVRSNQKIDEQNVDETDREEVLETISESKEDAILNFVQEPEVDNVDKDDGPSLDQDMMMQQADELDQISKVIESDERTEEVLESNEVVEEVEQSNSLKDKLSTAVEQETESLNEEEKFDLTLEDDLVPSEIDQVVEKCDSVNESHSIEKDDLPDKSQENVALIESEAVEEDSGENVAPGVSNEGDGRHESTTVSESMQVSSNKQLEEGTKIVEETEVAIDILLKEQDAGASMSTEESKVVVDSPVKECEGTIEPPTEEVSDDIAKPMESKECEKSVEPSSENVTELIEPAQEADEISTTDEPEETTETNEESHPEIATEKSDEQIKESVEPDEETTEIVDSSKLDEISVEKPEEPSESVQLSVVDESDKRDEPTDVVAEVASESSTSVAVEEMAEFPEPPGQTATEEMSTIEEPKEIKTITDNEEDETALAVASLENIDMVDNAPLLTEKEKQEMEALRQAVESITDSTEDNVQKIDDEEQNIILATAVSTDATVESKDAMAESENATTMSEDATEMFEDATAVSEDAAAVSEDAHVESENATAVSEDATVMSEDATAVSEDAHVESENASAASEDATAVSEDVTAVSEDAAALSEVAHVELENANAESEDATTVSEDITEMSEDGAKVLGDASKVLEDAAAVSEDPTSSEQPRDAHTTSKAVEVNEADTKSENDVEESADDEAIENEVKSSKLNEQEIREEVLPDSSQSLSDTEALEFVKDKEKDNSAKSNERPRRHKKVNDNKSEEVNINADASEREKCYSPKVTIKPIKVPDEEVSTTSNSDPESGKGSLKMTITKQSDKMHSILKVCDVEQPEAAQEQEEPLPKLKIKSKAVEQVTPKMSTRSSRQSSQAANATQRSSSPRITIKPVVKPETLSPLKIKIGLKTDDSTKKHSPKLNIKPLPKPEDESKEMAQSPRKVVIKNLGKPPEEEEQAPKIIIKPIPKPDTEKEGPNVSTKLNIKPIKKPEEEENDTEKVSPKIIIKPIVKPAESDSHNDETEEESKKRIVLKINKGNLPPKESRKREHPPEDDKAEKLAKITVKFSKEGGHPHIVQQPEESPQKRPHEDSTSLEKNKKQKVENDSIISTRSKQKDHVVEPQTENNPSEPVSENSQHSKTKLHITDNPGHGARGKHKDSSSNSPIETKRSKLRESKQKDNPESKQVEEEVAESTVAASPVTTADDSISNLSHNPGPDSTPISTPEVVACNPTPASSDAPVTPTPRKRGRPRKIPLEQRPDFKDGQTPPPVQPKPAETPPTPTTTESGRPKRSCRGQSALDTLGLKPRKPRGSRGGRGGRPPGESRAISMKPEK